jgi:dihydroorotate dehydrogenase
MRLLSEIQNKNTGYAKPAPILLKIAPDLTPEGLETVLEVTNSCHIQGIVATNTTLSREGLSLTPQKMEALGAGGISGAPLTHRAEQFCRAIRRHMPSGMVLVASGGVMSAADVSNRLAAGADLVQLYTGLIYTGPSLIADSIAASPKK